MAKATQKRTCSGCKASVLAQGCGYGCSLGYDVDVKRGAPKEVCPKPKTYMELVALQQKI